MLRKKITKNLILINPGFSYYLIIPLDLKHKGKRAKRKVFAFYSYFCRSS